MGTHNQVKSQISEIRKEKIIFFRNIFLYSYITLLIHLFNFKKKIKQYNSKKIHFPVQTLWKPSFSQITFNLSIKKQ